MVKEDWADRLGGREFGLKPGGIGREGFGTGQGRGWAVKINVVLLGCFGFGLGIIGCCLGCGDYLCNGFGLCWINFHVKWVSFEV